MNLIKISTDLELSVHEFPTGTHEEQNNKLRELIGNDCRLSLSAQSTVRMEQERAACLWMRLSTAFMKNRERV